MSSFMMLVFSFVATIQVVLCKAGFSDEDFDFDRSWNYLHFKPKWFRGPKHHNRDYYSRSCDIDENNTGKCVPEYHCDHYFEELPPCGRYYERKVCCPISKEDQEASASRVDNRVIKSSPFPKAPDCHQAIMVEARIAGGNDAKAGRFPWMAALWYSRRGRYLCGGSVITSRHVMTAAHCARRDLHHVRVGDVDLNRTDDTAGPVDIMVKKAMQHEGYDNTTRVHDIGLLVLAKELQFNNFIKPICLPPIESLDLQVRKSNYVGEDAVVAGWGAIEYGGPSVSKLQFAKLRVLSNKKCETAYDNYPVVINESNLCAGDPGLGDPRKDSCSGDSGGPLMYTQPSSQRYYQIGIVAFGYQCGKPDFPGLYTRVDQYLQWLEDKVTQN